MEKKCEGGSCNCGCSGGMMHGFHGHKHHLIKMILKLIILGIIFCYAFKLGEINGSLESGRSYGGREMMRGGNYGYGMMGVYNNSDINAQPSSGASIRVSAPTSASATTKAQ